MDIKIETDVFDPAWSGEWSAARNAAVSALIADGVAGRLRTKGTADLSRDDHDDEQMRLFFQRQNKPWSERCASERSTSPDAYLYEGVTCCMKAARADERQRIAKAISAGLKALLGDEFLGIMSDIADENDICHD